MGFVCRGYGRASTDGQVISTQKQHAVCLDIFEFKKRTNPEWADAVWGGWVADEATCRETQFRTRHFGSLILAATKPRDRILCAAHDRLFGDLIDFCETMKLCETMKFVVVVGDKEIDYADEANVCYYKIITAFAELEVKRLRRRCREAIAYRKRVGRPATSPLIGWKHVVVKIPGIPEPQRYQIPDNRARRYARELLAIVTHRKLSFTQASQYCNSIGHTQLNGKRWTVPTFVAWCRAAQNNFVLPNGSHDACPIPADAIPVKVETISADD
jgi:DNA invertase Pin-like site-specific DNA recombinase